MVNITGAVYWLLDGLKGSAVRRHYREIASLLGDGTAEAQIKKHQNERLAILFDHARKQCAFYRNNAAHTFEELSPVNKQIIRENESGFLSEQHRDVKLYSLVTSGSTGYPFTVLQDQSKKERNTADALYYNGRVGYELGTPLYYLKIWNEINRKSWLLKNMQGIRPHDVRDSSEKGMMTILNSLQKESKPVFFLGYATALEQLGRVAEKLPAGKLTGKIRGVVTMSEALDKGGRQMIARNLQTPVFARYSNMENGIIAQQTDDSQRFLINRASYIVEIFRLDSDTPCAPGESGRIIVTDLYNFAMPMLRYDTGDIGVISADRKYLEQIEGRKMDTIYDTKGGTLSSFIVTNSMWSYAELSQYQFIQVTKNSYLFKLNAPDGFSREDDLVSEFKNYLGADADIRVEYVLEIPQLDSGKRKKVMNIMDNPS